MRTPSGLERERGAAVFPSDADSDGPTEVAQAQPPLNGNTPPGNSDKEDDDVFVFPATAAQRRFWLLDQLVAGGNPALNVPLAIRLRGRLEKPALERAFNALVDRHEVLRTTFRCSKGQLCQVIAPNLDLPVTVVDARDFPENERAHVADHLIAEEALLPFDLARGPVIRTRLVQVAAEDHFLLITLHHIVCDGWSNGVLLRDLGALYGAFSAGKKSPLAELPIQFADFAQWQIDRANGPEKDRNLAYWCEKLAGTLPILDLPANRPRLPLRGRAARGDVRWRPLPAPLTAALKALAVREGVSSYMLFLAAFTEILSRYGGSEDVLVSTPSANRNSVEVEGLVGLFVNPLLLRLNVAGDPTFRSLLAGTRTAVLGAFEHADTPFERVLEEVQPRRVQVNFLYQNAFLQPVKGPELDMIPLGSVSGGALFEWIGAAIEDAGGVKLCIEYDADLFDAETIDRVLADFESLLAAVSAPAGSEMTLSELRSAAGNAPGGHSAALSVAHPWRLTPASLEWIKRFCEPGIASGTNSAGSVAHMRDGAVLCIRDRSGKPVPTGVGGEICVGELPSGPSDASGASAKSPASMGPKPFQTGDYGRLEGDQVVQWLGRMDAQAGVGGFHVELAAIEKALRAHPHVRETVVQWREAQGKRELAAYFESDGAPAALVSAPELRAFLKETLPEDWIPALFIPVQRFPMTAEGRLDEGALPRPTAAAWERNDQHYEAPYLTIHHQLVEIWQGLLHVPQIGIHDNFFALGGDSLLAMRMLYRVEQTCGKALLPATLFENATIEHLAGELLESHGGGPAPEIIAIQEKGAKSPIFFFHGDLTGGGFYCMKLSRRLGPDQPFYALPPLDISGYDELPTIESIAAVQLRTIRATRAQGPYVLGGFCLGGLIAHEVARQLEAEGETVERLLIIDATVRNRRLKILRSLAEWLGKRRHLSQDRQLYYFCHWHFVLARIRRWRGLAPGQQLGIVRRRLAEAGVSILRRLRISAGANEMKTSSASAPPPGDGEEGIAPDGAGGSTMTGAWFDPRWDVPLVFLWATGGYYAGSFSGAATLLLSSDLTGRHAEESVVSEWRRHVGQLDTRDLAGSHLACITEHVDGLAETIRECLDEKR